MATDAKPTAVHPHADKSIADLTEEIRLDPYDASAFAQRGEIYAKTGDHDRAIADFKEAIRLDPASAAAYVGRGGTLYVWGDRDRAIIDLGKAIQIDPSHANTCFNPFGDEESSAGDIDRYEVILSISVEVRHLLGLLAAESQSDEIDVIRKAVGLYKVAMDAHRDGKVIAILDQDLELETEVVGFSPNQTHHA